MNKQNSVNDLSLYSEDHHLPFIDIMEGIDTNNYKKFKCQNKQGINLISELAGTVCDKEDESKDSVSI
jgi:hypothetical protein